MRHDFAKFEGKRNMQKFEKALADEYRGKLVRKTVIRGEWNKSHHVTQENNSQKTHRVKSKNAAEIKFLSDEMCTRITSFYHTSYC